MQLPNFLNNAEPVGIQLSSTNGTIGLKIFEPIWYYLTSFDYKDWEYENSSEQ